MSLELDVTVALAHHHISDRCTLHHFGKKRLLEYRRKYAVPDGVHVGLRWCEEHPLIEGTFLFPRYARLYKVAFKRESLSDLSPGTQEHAIRLIAQHQALFYTYILNAIFLGEILSPKLEHDQHWVEHYQPKGKIFNWQSFLEAHKCQLNVV